MRNILLVARRELQAGIMKRSFVVTTAIMVALLMVGIFVLNYFMTRESADSNGEQIVFTSESGPLMDPLERAAAEGGLNLEPVAVESAQQGEAALAQGDATAFISGIPPQITITFESSPNQTVVAALTKVLQDQTMAEQVENLGGDPTEFAQTIASAVPNVTVLDADGDEFGPEYLLAIVVTALLLFGLMTSGSIISMGVVEEKASRVVEILLATIRPSQLFAGKVLGAGLIGLVQLLIYGGAIFAAVKITGLFEGFDIPVGMPLLAMIGWFIIGFASIGTLWGALSSLVSRQEDVGSITAPMIFMTMIPFYVGIYLVPNAPESSWTTNLSIAPFFAPFVMPVRQAITAVPSWQLVLAVALNIAVVPLIVWIAGTVYQRSILHTGSRMKLGEVFAKKA